MTAPLAVLSLAPPADPRSTRCRPYLKLSALSIAWDEAPAFSSLAIVASIAAFGASAGFACVVAGTSARIAPIVATTIGHVRRVLLPCTRSIQSSMGVPPPRRHQ